MKNLVRATTLFLFLFCLAQPTVAGKNFLFPNSNYQTSRSASPLLDSAIAWQWNTATSEFDIYEAENYFGYDSSGRIIFTQNDTSTWDPTFQDSIYYNGQNQITTEFYQSWIGTDWDNGGLSFYYYNNDNLLDSVYGEAWDGTAYEPFEGVYYTYAADSTIRSIIEWIDDGGWFPVLLDTFTYDAHHNVLTDLTFNWTGSAWENYSLTQYTYNANNIATGALMQAWTIQGWHPSGRVINNFDANGNVLSAIDSDFTYNLVDSIHYYYQGTAAGVRDIVNAPAVSVYPNPAGSYVNISFTNSTGAPLKLTLFDITGQALLTQSVAANPVRLDVSNLASGAYELSVTDNEGNRTVRQVMVR